MEEIVEAPIKVYVEINYNNDVVAVGSSIFIQDLNGWKEIDFGYGDKYAHAQSQYFNKPIKDENGSYNYYYTNGVVKEK